MWYHNSQIPFRDLDPTWHWRAVACFRHSSFERWGWGRLSWLFQCRQNFVICKATRASGVGMRVMPLNAKRLKTFSSATHYFWGDSYAKFSVFVSPPLVLLLYSIESNYKGSQPLMCAEKPFKVLPWRERKSGHIYRNTPQDATQLKWLVKTRFAHVWEYISVVQY